MSKIRFFNDESACICLCGLKFPKEKYDDKCPNPLKNWELWLEKRKKVHEKLGKDVGRTPGDLLMNASEEYRNVKEDKLVLEYTNIVTNFDKLRGNPAFWRLPYSLGHNNSTEYFAVQSKQDKNEIPSIEYIGTPNYILEEKGVMPRTRNMYKLWENNNDYRQQVMERKTSKILQIEPHRPDLDLILIGEQVKIDIPEEENPPLSETKDSPRPSVSITESLVRNDEECEKMHRISLKINKLTFNKDYNSYCDNKMTILFEYYMDTRVPCQQTILIENTGAVVLRLYWTEYTRLKIFREYCTDSSIYHPFKFNRNEILLLPGEKLDFIIEFKTIKPGNFVESWELTTLPKIWNYDFHFVIVFKGFAFMKHFDEKANILIGNLNQRIRNTVVKDLLSDIISKGTYSNKIVTHSYDFSEKELFESVNLKDNICLRTPKYVYNEQIITELKELYQEMKQPTDDEIWNLSIKNLKEIGRKKDLLIYFENNVTAYDTARMKRMSLRDNGANDPTTKEYKTDKAPIGKSVVKARKDIPANFIELEDQTQSPSYNSRLKDIIQRLEKPSIRENLERRKYLYCYTIVKTYIFKMFDNLYFLDDHGDKEQDLLLVDEDTGIDESKDQIRKSRQDIARDRPKEMQYFQDRLSYDIFDEGYISRTKRVPSESACGVAKPKSALLRNISLSDAKRICKIYFNKDESNEKGQKKKTPAEETKKAIPSKKVEKSKTQNQTEHDLLQNVREDYDPFIEELPVEFEKGDNSSIQLDLRLKTYKEIKNYDDKYIFIYTSLCDAVDELVKTMDSFKEESIPSDTLNEMRKCITLPVKSNRGDTDLQPKTVISTDESITEKTQSDGKDEYFQFLLETHWENNMKTKKYFVQEKKNLLKKIQEQDGRAEDLVRIPSNIFSLESFQRKPEPPGTKEKEVQTTEIKFINKMNIERDPSIHKGSIDSSSSKNIFYFLDSCDQDDDDE